MELERVEAVSRRFKKGARYDALSGGGSLILDMNQIDTYTLDKIQDAIAGNTDHIISQHFAINAGVAVYGRVEYETFFGQIFTSEFCFGTRRPRRYEGRVVRDIYNGEGVGPRIEKEEVPVKLTRLPVHCEVYKRKCS